jgi:flavin-dependent dehydrogenase
VRDPQGWAGHLTASGPTSARVNGGTPDTAPRVWAAGTQRLSVVQGNGWAAAGDAACAWDPLSSAGILKALRTARVAAFVALDHARGQPDDAGRYARIIQREHAAYRLTHAWFYGQEERWHTAPFWARRRNGA